MGWQQSLAGLLVAPSFVLVVERNREVVGFVHAGAANDNPQQAEIHGFYVHPSAWGTGAAARLIDAACARLAERWDAAVLWTLRDAARARRFYQNHGFQVTGNARLEALTDWMGGEPVMRPAVEYRKRGEGGRSL